MRARALAVFVVTLAAMLPLPAEAASGGPGPGGVTWVDSRGGGAFGVDPPAYAPLELGSGAAQLALKDDEASAVPLGFTFHFQGQARTEAHVASNGLLSFVAAGAAGCCPVAGLAPGGPSHLVAGYWADLDPGLPGGAVRVATLGAPGARVFVAAWEDVPLRADPDRRVTFQLHLREGSNVAEAHYAALPDGAGVAGVEGADGEVLAYPLPAGGLAGVAVRYTPNRAPAIEALECPARANYRLRADVAVRAADPEGRTVDYEVDFGHETAATTAASGVTARFSTRFELGVGVHRALRTVEATAADPLGAASAALCTIEVVNEPPVVLASAAGPSRAGHGIPAAFRAVAADPERAGLTTLFAWGDGRSTLVAGASGEAAEASHAWRKPGTYTVSATVSDELGWVVGAGSQVVEVVNTPPAAPGRAVLSLTPTAACVAAALAPCAEVRAGDVAVARPLGSPGCNDPVAEGPGAALSGWVRQVPVPRLVPVPVCVAVPPDPNGDDLAEVVFDWGDGSPPTRVAPAWGPATGRWYATAVHAFPLLGDHAVRAWAVDEHGAASEASLPLYVLAPA